MSEQAMTKAEEAELRRLKGKHRDIWTYGAGALEHEAAKRERQMRMSDFVIQHGIACFKCSQSFGCDWAKTGFSARGPWALCLRCVRKPKETA